MRIDQLTFLLDFDAWATERVFSRTQSLSDADFSAAPGPGHAVPRATLLHIVSGMRVWRGRLQGAAPNTPVPESDADTPVAVHDRWRTEHAAVRAYVAGLSDADLAHELEIPRPDGNLRGPRWQFVAHLVFHHMQHRSELAQALTLLGRSPGELGLTAFLQDRLGSIA
jgi:uncharacterized damage-inducible protein DinB